MKGTASFEYTEAAKHYDITPQEIEIWKKIKQSIGNGHNIEVRKTPDGHLKVLEVQKKNITGSFTL